MKQTLLLLLICSTIFSRPATYEELTRLQKDVDALSDTIVRLKMIAEDHEKYIGFDMMHKGEQHQKNTNIEKVLDEAGKVDFNYLISIIVIGLVSGGQVLLKLPIVKALILLLASTYKKNGKQNGG